MKILYVVPIHREKAFLEQRKSEIDEYGTIRYPLLVGQIQNSWIKALTELGHEVHVFISTNSFLLNNTLRIHLKDFSQRKFPLVYQKYCRLWGKLYFISLENHLRNKALIRKAEEMSPDFIILTAGSVSIFPHTIRYIKKNLNTKVILTVGVSPVLTSNKIERKIAMDLDAVITNDKYHAVQFLELGAKKTLVLPGTACEPEFHRFYELTAEERKELGSDVCFVGSLYPRIFHRDRLEAIEALTDFDLAIWSPNEKEILGNALLRKHYRGQAWGTKMYKIYNASKIIMNPHGHTMQGGGNMRTFEITGCGGFQLTDRVDPAWFKIGTEIEVYRSISELRSKVNYYLKNPDQRESVARNGQQRAYRDHTYVGRIKKLVRFLLAI